MIRLVTDPFAWDLPYAWPRKPILARNVVCTSQPLAAQAGLEMLSVGGNAVDAIVATAITISLVEPVSNGIGADAFAIVWDGSRLYGLNACGRSPEAWTPEYFHGADVPLRGWDSVTVPGAVSAWVELHARFGRLPFPRLFERAIRYGRDGFLVSPTVSRQWAAQVTELRSQPGFADAFLPGGRAPMPGELFRFPAHAETLKLIAESNGESFYRGELAERMVADAVVHGGAMTVADLGAHRADWVGVISGDYRDYTVHEMPPNGQGIIALIALGILANFDMGSLAVDSARTVHLQIEACKLGFADALDYVADIDAMPFDPDQLLNKNYLAERAALIDPNRAQTFGAGTPPAGGTVYLTAADANGMMVSMIQSNYESFGSGVVAAGTGIALQNRGAGFVATPGHPNQVGPRKRPRHSILPAFVTRGGRPVMSFGVMGTTMQPQGHVQVLARIADHGQNPQAACDGPRFRWVQGMQVAVEDGFPPATIDELRRLGHEIVSVGDYSAFGACQAIWRIEDGYLAVSDPRKDGQAVGF